MRGVKKISLKWIKCLMVTSQVLLLLFAVQWLHTQFTDQQEDLKKDLTGLFASVQQDISDLLLLTNIINPASARVATGENNDEKPAVPKPPIAMAAPVGSEDKIADTPLSPQGLRLMLNKVSKLSKADEKKFFSMDTIVFNDIFTGRMKDKGWDFNAAWISDEDSALNSKKIFIQSNFFTHQHGIVVGNYKGYLLRKCLPQFLFISILLFLSAAAMWVTFRSLRDQLRLSRLKDDFISNMSHELKTPIATVKLALEALNNFNVIEQPELSREYLGMASSEMDRLELLATHALNTSLLESGKLYLQREQYDLKKLVEEVATTMQPRYQQSGAHISLDIRGEQFTVPIDKLHTQGVLINILDNSLKYGVKPVHVVITLTQNEGKVQMAIADNGPGIPEEYKEKVFEKFFRVPTGNRHDTKGYGLGLSYAAQVMRQHNGGISVDNISGGGCMFTLTF